MDVQKGHQSAENSRERHSLCVLPLCLRAIAACGMYILTYHSHWHDLRETEVQRQRVTTSPDPEKIPEPLRGPLGGFPVEIPREEKSAKSL